MFNVKKLIFILVLSFISVSVFSSNDIISNRKLGDFNSVFIDCTATIYLEVSNQNSVFVKTVEENKDNILTEVKDNTLNILGSKNAYFTKNNTAIYIKVKNLKQVKMICKGLAIIKAADKLKTLDIIGDKGGEIRVEKLTCDKMDINLKDNSCINLEDTMKAAELKISLEDTSQLNADIIKSKNVIIDDKSRRNLTLHTLVAKGNCDINIKGSGSVKMVNIGAEYLKVDSTWAGAFIAKFIPTCKAKELMINMTNCGNIFFDSVNADKLDVKMMSTGDIKITGNVDDQIVKMTGSGNYFGHRLKCNDLKIANTGSGIAYVYAVNNANIKLRGGGDVYVRGNPVKIVDKRASFGEIRMIREQCKDLYIHYN